MMLEKHAAICKITMKQMEMLLLLVSSGFHEKKYLLTITGARLLLVALANRLEKEKPRLSEETPKANRCRVSDLQGFESPTSRSNVKCGQEVW